MEYPSLPNKRRQGASRKKNPTFRQQQAYRAGGSYYGYPGGSIAERTVTAANTRSTSQNGKIDDSGRSVEETNDIITDEVANGTKVVVYILSSSLESDNIKLLEALFTDPIFLVKIINIPPPVGLNGNGSLTIYQAIEAYRVTTVLADAAANYPDLDVIILKENSATNASADDVSVVVKTILEETGWDLCYLCRWLDRCDLYRNVRTIPGKTSVLTATKSPNGIQALMFSQSGRDIVIGAKPMKNGSQFPPIVNPLSTQLNEQIEMGNISAICVVPNLIEYNVLDATNVSDLAKLTDCRRPENNGDEGPGVLPFVWFIVIVVGIILLAWAFWYIGPKYPEQI